MTVLTAMTTTSITKAQLLLDDYTHDNESDADIVGKVEITKRIMIVTLATPMTLITSIDMRTLIIMMTRAMAILPTNNDDVDGNVEDAYTNDLEHNDDN